MATGYEDDDLEHEADRCLSCGCLAFDWCDLRLLAEEYQVDMDHFKGYARKHKVDDRHPYLVYDPNKCILCARCVRASRDLDGKNVFQFVERGPERKVQVNAEARLGDTDADISDQVVDVCPVGALMRKHVGFAVPVGERLYDVKPIGHDIEKQRTAQEA